MYNKLYTAVGILRTSGKRDSNECPTVAINGKEHILSIHEMTLWSVLNWRILSQNEAYELFEKKQKQFGFENNAFFGNILERLKQRGLIAEGIGDTPADALYDLLSELYVIPITENVFLRMNSFFRLTFINKIPISVTRQIFGTDKRSTDEKKVIKLAKKTLLSTAEIIKCIEYDKINFTGEEQIMDLLYHDEFTTCDNIAESSRNMKNCRAVLTSVANLLLRRQIVLERI